MRRSQVVLLVTFFGALVAVYLLRPPALTKEERAADLKARLETDLELRAELLTPAVVRPGGGVAVQVTLINHAPLRSHRVVIPPDASVTSIREPHLLSKASVNCGDGNWMAVTDRNVGPFCAWEIVGRRNVWSRDVQELKAGESIQLPVAQDYEFRTPGCVRLVFTYDFSPERARPAYRLAPSEEPALIHELAAVPEPIADVPAFRLVSNTIEFTVAGP